MTNKEKKKKKEKQNLSKHKLTLTSCCLCSKLTYCALQKRSGTQPTGGCDFLIRGAVRDVGATGREGKGKGVGAESSGGLRQLVAAVFTEREKREWNGRCWSTQLSPPLHNESVLPPPHPPHAPTQCFQRPAVAVVLPCGGGGGAGTALMPHGAAGGQSFGMGAELI